MVKLSFAATDDTRLLLLQVDREYSAELFQFAAVATQSKWDKIALVGWEAESVCNAINGQLGNSGRSGVLQSARIHNHAILPVPDTQFFGAKS